MPLILHVLQCTHAVLPEMIKNNRPQSPQKRNWKENSGDAFLFGLCTLDEEQRGELSPNGSSVWSVHRSGNRTEGSDALSVG
jgi:hypothetical protein